MGIEERAKKLNHKNTFSAPRNDFGNRNQGGFRNGSGSYRNSYGNNRPYGRQPQQLTKIRGEDPSPIGSPFYNPYTFIPFPTKVERDAATFLTADEVEMDRFTGVLNLKVKTLSPLMTCDPVPYTPKEEDHKKFHALTIGNDVVLPATSVRGSLRTLMTILAGGTLGYMDTNMWLCQGRDLTIGPTPSNKNLPVFLAKVESPGGYMRSGKLRLGQAWLIDFEELKKLARKNDFDLELSRPGATDAFFVDNSDCPTVVSKKKSRLCPFVLNREKKVFYVDDYKNPSCISLEKNERCYLKLRKVAKTLYVNDHENPTLMADSDKECHYEVKLSGCPVGKGKVKREGIFLAGDTIVDIPAPIWETYIGRNRSGFRKELRIGDLVWIEPKNSNGLVQSADDIESIQWARWGRKGQNLQDALPYCVLPDCMREDGLVDVVTDLWGQVPMVDGKGDSFAARIRPHNIVFENGTQKLDKEIHLAPLAQPHPGCLPFYRNGKSDTISNADELNGYKVYRNTSAHGANAPWLYSVQGIFDKKDVSKMSSEFQKMNKTVDLLSEGVEGYLKISCRGLNKKELALLLLSCCVDWKLGGGKPLGLGHCRVVKAELVDEFGEKVLDMAGDGNCSLCLPDEYAAMVTHLDKRVELYRKSQEPVDLLRYPRAVGRNRGGLRREGLTWFPRHASMKTPKKGEPAKGLQTFCVGGKYFNGMVLGNMVSNPGPLYGYDMIAEGKSVGDCGNKNCFETIEPYDPSKHKSESRRFDNNSQNRYTRRDDRRNR